MNIYNGGSEKDELMISLAGNSVPSSVTSISSQMFITFTTDGNGIGKGFIATITFGNTSRTDHTIIIYFSYIYYVAETCSFSPIIFLLSYMSLPVVIVHFTPDLSKMVQTSFTNV